MSKATRKLEEYTDEQIREAIEREGGVRPAARALGVPRGTLRRWQERQGRGSEGPQTKQGNYYEYDGTEDIYTFYTKAFPNEVGGFKLPGEVFRGMVRDYSKQKALGGANMNKGEIALKYGKYVSLPVLEQIFKVAGVYKVDPPFTNERIQEATPEDFAQMVEEGIQERKRFLIARADKRDHEQIFKEVMQLREEKHRRESTLSDLQAAAADLDLPTAPPIGPVRKLDDPLTDDTYAVLSGMADLHSGKHAWGKESYGGDYDVNIAYDNIAWTAEETARHVGWVEKLGVVERLFLCNVGDHFHALDGATESGTRLEQDTRAFKVWAKTFDAEVQKIDYLRCLGIPIDWRGSPGNHDHMFFQFFAFTLLQRYRECEDVTIHTTPRWQDAFLYKRTLHVLDHMKGIPANLNTSAAKLAADRVAREAGGELYYDSRYQNFYGGHLHEYSTATEGNHLRLIRLLPMSPGDEYEAKGRWHGPFGFNLFTLRGDDGRIDSTRDLYLEKVA